MIKILYDSQIFSLQKFGGISRYINELIFNDYRLYEPILAGKYFENEYLKKSSYYKPLPIREMRYKKYIVNELNKIYSCNVMCKGEYDILHATYYDTYFLHSNKKPFVVDAHDMIQELFPRNTVAQHLVRGKKSVVMHKANAIIAVSENTKKDILKIYPDLDESKIFVCHRGCFWDLIHGNIKKENYILFTGQRSYYKNFVNFIRAVAPLLQKYNINLICTGHSFSKNELALFKENNIEQFVKIEFADDEKLKYLYSHAMCFVYPSLYEGFGLPILEAWSMRCPLVLSNTSCFPEIAGDAGVFFNPNSVMDMREKIEQVIMDMELQKQIVYNGIKRMALFQWKEKIKQVAGIYQKILY